MFPLVMDVCLPACWDRYFLPMNTAISRESDNVVNVFKEYTTELSKSEDSSEEEEEEVILRSFEKF